ncbi:MAG: hypothetical protein RBT49_18665 [Bacteroidales bacterium]|nr:hypothetical protein [Bacteroidales bacterium]
MRKLISLFSIAGTLILALSLFSSPALAQNNVAGNYGISTTSSLWSSNGINIFNNNVGYVGIGTQNPSEKLEVAGNILAKGLFLKDNNTSAYISYANTASWPGIMEFSSPNGFSFLGSIGINHDSVPQANLHVNGSMMVNGIAKLNGSITTNDKLGLTKNYAITGSDCVMSFTNGLLTASTCTEVTSTSMNRTSVKRMR